jgi:hypothetical protein
MATGLRIVTNHKAKLGQQPGEKEEEMTDKKKQNLLKDIRAAYKLVTDGVVGNIPTLKKFEKDGMGTELISDFTELVLVDLYAILKQSEERQFRLLGPIIEEWPIWNAFLKGVRGVGPAMAGVIISEIDISKAAYPSSIWKYAGLDVAQDGKGRSRQKQHLVEIEYTNKAGEPATKKGITFNPFLKTKLTGVLADLFIRMKSPESDHYYNYKTRIEERDLTKGHKHNMAKRYMIKRFLADLYVVWRTLEGLSVAPDYHEAKLGHTHGGTPATPSASVEELTGGLDDADIQDAEGVDGSEAAA